VHCIANLRAIDFGILVLCPSIIVHLIQEDGGVRLGSHEYEPDFSTAVRLAKRTSGLGLNLYPARDEESDGMQLSPEEIVERTNRKEMQALLETLR
jgi:hypothetical protein